MNTAIVDRFASGLLSINSPWLPPLFWGVVLLFGFGIASLLGWSWRDMVDWLTWENRNLTRELEDEIQADEEAFYRRKQLVEEAVAAREELRRRSPWRDGSDPTI